MRGFIGLKPNHLVVSVSCTFFPILVMSSLLTFIPFDGKSSALPEACKAKSGRAREVLSKCHGAVDKEFQLTLNSGLSKLAPRERGQD